MSSGTTNDELKAAIEEVRNDGIKTQEFLKILETKMASEAHTRSGYEAKENSIAQSIIIVGLAAVGLGLCALLALTAMPWLYPVLGYILVTFAAWQKYF